MIGEPTVFYTREQKHVVRFLKQAREAGRFVQIQYVRGAPSFTGTVTEHGLKLGRGEPEGVFLAWEDNFYGMNFGWSLRHPTKEKDAFSRVKAIHMALRMHHWPLSLVVERLPAYRRNEFYDFMRDAQMRFLKVQKIREQSASMTA